MMMYNSDMTKCSQQLLGLLKGDNPHQLLIVPRQSSQPILPTTDKMSFVRQKMTCTFAHVIITIYIGFGGLQFTRVSQTAVYYLLKFAEGSACKLLP